MLQLLPIMLAVIPVSQGQSQDLPFPKNSVKACILHFPRSEMLPNLWQGKAQDKQL